MFTGYIQLFFLHLVWRLVKYFHLNKSVFLNSVCFSVFIFYIFHVGQRMRSSNETLRRRDSLTIHFPKDARISRNRNIISRVIVYFLNTMFLHMTLGNLCYFNPATMCSKEFELETMYNSKFLFLEFWSDQLINFVPCLIVDRFFYIYLNKSSTVSRK